MKRIFVIILLLLLIPVTGCKNTSYVNTKDFINDGDEAIIKEFRSNNGYTYTELKTLDIRFLGTVDGYKIYYAAYNGEESGSDWTKDGYTFPAKSETRIVGIKSKRLYVLGELLFETRINTKQLYNLIPEEFKGHEL